MRFEDPLWQLALYIGMNPVFRLLHADKHNLVSFSLAGLGAVYLKYNPWTSLCLALFAGLIALLKHYLVCGPMQKVYLTDRYYNSSWLDTTGDVPILYLDGGDSFSNGFDYGIIMCEEIIHLICRFKTIVNPKVPVWFLKEVDNNLPKVIRSEIKGMYEAINSVYPGKLTYWDLLTIQMVPELDNMGCTCYATYNAEADVILGRNMDWLPFSSAQYSIIVNYCSHNYRSLVVPGLVGCVTAWTPNYALAMNVVGLERELDTQLLPSMLFNKTLVIQANTFALATKMASERHPMAPYHLTIANKDDVHTMSYYQGPGEDTYIRKLSDLNSNLSVLNWTYPNNDNGRYISQFRDIRTKDQTNRGIDHVKDILHQCQTFETMHSVIFDFTNGTLNVTIAIDNGFAADLL